MDLLVPDVQNLLIEFYNTWELCKVDKKYRSICKNIYKQIVNHTMPGLEKYPIQYNYEYLKLIGGKLYSNRINWKDLTFTRIKPTSHSEIVTQIIPPEYSDVEPREDVILKLRNNKYMFIEPQEVSTGRIDYISIPKYQDNVDEIREITGTAQITDDNKLMIDMEWSPTIKINKPILMFGLVEYGDFFRGTETVFILYKDCTADLYSGEEDEFFPIDNIDFSNVTAVCIYVSNGAHMYMGTSDGNLLTYQVTEEDLHYISTIKYTDHPIIQIIPIRNYIKNPITIFYILDAKGNVYIDLNNVIKKIESGVRKMISITHESENKNRNAIGFIKKNKVVIRNENNQKLTIPINKPIIDVCYNFNSLDNTMYYILD